MRIYFYTNQASGQVKEMFSYLRRVGMIVVSNLSSQVQQKSTSQELPLDKVDTLIVEGAKLDTKSAYLIATGLSQNKNVLCLLPQGSKIDATLKNLQADSNFGKRLKIEFYTDKNWQDILSTFLQSLDKKSVRELFNIKYTLRISSKISDFLNWKARQVGVRKADWLRDQIQAIIKQDADYQKFLKTRFKTKEK